MDKSKGRRTVPEYQLAQPIGGSKFEWIRITLIYGSRQMRDKGRAVRV
jgi:hypothetical protein